MLQLAHLGRRPHLTLTLLARLARMLPGGPVGPDGTLSPFISDPAGPAGPYVAGGPVGPYWTLSPFNSDPDGPCVAGGPVGPFGTLSPSDSGSAILVDPDGGTLLPGEGGPKLCRGILTDDLVLVAAVPLWTPWLPHHLWR